MATKVKAETVTVSKAEYDSLVERLQALENRQATGTTRAPGFYPLDDEEYQGKVTKCVLLVTA
jgi:hypothetical protein